MSLTCVAYVFAGSQRKPSLVCAKRVTSAGAPSLKVQESCPTFFANSGQTHLDCVGRGLQKETKLGSKIGVVLGPKLSLVSFNNRT
jgi:hypothetical protein